MTVCVNGGLGLQRQARAALKQKSHVQCLPRRGTAIAMAFVLGCVFCGSSVRAQQVQTINPYGRDVEFSVALREGQFLIGELPLHISKSGSLSVSLTALVTLLGNRIIPQSRSSLLALPTIEGLVTFDTLAQLGYVLVFNDTELDLAISIPLAAKPSRDYSVMGAQREEIGDFDRVSGFSFAANLRVVGDYSRSDFGEEFSSSGNLSILGRIGQVAYQSSYRTSGNGAGLLHEGSRFIVDDVERALRWQVGDIRPFSSSSVGGDDILGFGVSRETDSLQPDYIARIRGTQSFSLEEPSQVTVSVNGRVVTRRMFAPGNYNIADFPFVVGRNQIELTILNQSGEQKQLSFNQFLDSRLLETGTSDFGLAFGIASRSGFGQSRLYDPSAWTLNAHYIKGVSENLTLAVATTLSDQQRIILATGVYAGKTGISSGRVGLNVSETGRKIGTIGFGLVRTLAGDQRMASSRTFRFGLDSRIDFNDTADSLINMSVGYAWPLTNRMNASTDLRVSNSVASASFQTSYSLTRNLRIDVSLDWRFNKDNNFAGPGISIGLSQSFGSGGGQARGTYNSRLGESRLALSNSPNTGLGNWSNSLEVSSIQDGANITGTQSALFNRFELSLSESGSWNNNRASQRIGMSGASAFAFANGQLAWGRPVNDSFAIIGGHKSLEGRTISLDSRGSQAGTMARTGLFGPALISGLGTYSPRVISVNVQDPPFGYDIGSGTFRVSPPLFGGYRFVVGSDSAYTVTGILMLRTGLPVSLIAGVATSPDWPTTPPMTIFTNANGQFSASGLGVGRWSLKMRGLEGTFDFTVEVAQTSLVDVGTIAVGELP